MVRSSTAYWGGAEAEEEARRARAALAATRTDWLERATVKPSTVREVLSAAAERTRELDIEVDFEIACWLPLISLAVAGDARAIGPIPAAPPDEGGLYVDPEDHEKFERLSGEILDDLAEEVVALSPEEGALRRNGEYVAGSLLSWKWGYGDGRLARWTAAEIEEFLLGYAPRKISLHDDERDDLVLCAIAFLTFLADAGVLEGDTPETLARTAASVGDEVVEALGDRTRWGPAKALMTQAEADGIDLTDGEALQAWMDHFNARPFDERDQTLGPSLGGTKRSTGTASGSKQKRRERRRGTRAARRRNRR